MATYHIALFFHLLGALMFFSGIVLAGAGFESARRQAEPRAVLILLGIARAGVLLVALGALLLPIFGLWLVHLGHWGYGSGWVDWALGLYALSLALGALGGRTPRHARKLAVHLAGEGSQVSDELRSLLNDPLSRALNYASLLAVIAILALMVFKP